MAEAAGIHQGEVWDLNNYLIKAVNQNFLSLSWATTPVDTGCMEEIAGGESSITDPGIETDIRHGSTIEPFTGSIVQRTGGLLFSFLF